MPKVTVYIISHNYGEYVEQAIESVIAQTYSDWELFLIDDGSTDNTQEVFEKYQNTKDFKLYKTDGIGLPSVNNLAIKESNGKYIIRLDADDYFDENILLVLSNYLDLNPEHALVFPDFYLVDDEGSIFSHEWRRKLYKDDIILDEPPNGACTMIRTDILREIGCYREDLGAQDGFDIWLKIKDNYPSQNINLPLFYYRRHGSNLTEQPLRIVNARRSLKKDAASSELIERKPIIAVIPCRENYDFAKNLWSQKITGKSLLEYDIEVCIQSEYFDHIIVTCDNHDAQKTVDKYHYDKRIIFFHREKADTSPSSDIKSTLTKIAKKFDPSFTGLMLIRYIQTPFVSINTIEEALTTLVTNDADSSFSIERIRHEIFELRKNGLEILSNGKNGLLNSRKVYRDANTCMAIKTSNLKKGIVMGINTVGFPVSTAESFFIRSEVDLDFASNYRNP